MAALSMLSNAFDANSALDALTSSVQDAIELSRPPLDKLTCRGFIRAIMSRPGFKLDFRGQEPRAVLAMVADRLFGKGSFEAERNALADGIGELSQLMSDLVGGCRPQVAIRTFFAPGDLVWHVDRLNERTAFRLLWPIGRPAGMFTTSRDNIDETLFRGFMRREHPLLCRLDTRVMREGGTVEELWAHRPAQLEAMRSGRFPFLLDPDKVWQVAPDAASIHRVETPGTPGTYHRSSWANHDRPGFQIVITAAAD